tara:strand:- start:51 stop:914 length:864 start_codon:yes stop_codon:yes gene_type:complete
LIKKFSLILFKIIETLDNVFKKITNKSFLIYFNDFLIKSSYKKINILGNNVNFFIPNELTKWRVDTLFSLEPETLDWIDSFKNTQNIVFWDIGANIGLYSIYNALKNKNSKTISFEPSTSNLRVLSRNISINNLENKIQIVPIPLTNKENKFLMMKEHQFIEGGALNSFGESFGFDGKDFQSDMNYKLFGTTINYLLDNNILEIPDFIKIDVDGIEHLILEGASKHLRNKKIKSLSIEINENFEHQYEKVLDIMKKNEFKILHKKHNDEILDKNSKFIKTFNYIFTR